MAQELHDQAGAAAWKILQMHVDQGHNGAGGRGVGVEGGDLGKKLPQSRVQAGEGQSRWLLMFDGTWEGATFQTG